MVLMTKWDAGVALDFIQKEKASQWTGVPTMIQDLMLHPKFHQTDVSTLVGVGSGGAPLSPTIVAQTPKKFKNAIATNGYGLTETNGAICVNSGEILLKKPESCGQPFAIVEVKVVDKNKQKLGPNQPGELCIRSSGLVMKEYWRT